MSTTASSVVNKSSKKFGPKKPPARRPPLPKPATTSQQSGEDQLSQRADSQTPLLDLISPDHTASNPDNQISVDAHYNHVGPPGDDERPTRSFIQDESRLTLTVSDAIPRDRQSIETENTTHTLPASTTSKIDPPQPSAQSSSRPGSSTVQRLKVPEMQSQLAPGRTTRSAKAIQQTFPTHENARNVSRRMSLQAPVDVLNKESAPAILSEPPSKRRRTQKNMFQEANQQTSPRTETRGSQVDPTSKETPRQRRSRMLRERKACNAVSIDQTESIQATISPPGPVMEDQSESTQKRRKRRRRIATPEDSEVEELNPSEIRMLDLCADSRKGKISSLEKELREMDRTAAQQNARGELDEFLNESNDTQPQQDHSTEDQTSADAGRTNPTSNTARQQTIIRDGQIVLSENAGQIDRHANAAAEREKNQLPPIEESSRTKRVTSGTWLKRQNNTGWNEQLLDRFYQGLRMFGTDFEMISRMFPGRSRRSIKLKFVKEERSNYSRIKATLLGETVPVILEDYESLSGKTYNETSHYEIELANDRSRLEEEQEVQTQLMQEATAERERQAADERATASEQSGNDSSNTGKKKKRVSKGKKAKGKGQKGRHDADKPDEGTRKITERRREIRADHVVP